MSTRGAVDRAPARCSGSHGFDSRRHKLKFFLCYTLESCWLLCWLPSLKFTIIFSFITFLIVEDMFSNICTGQFFLRINGNSFKFLSCFSRALCKRSGIIRTILNPPMHAIKPSRMVLIILYTSRLNQVKFNFTNYSKDGSLNPPYPFKSNHDQN